MAKTLNYKHMKKNDFFDRVLKVVAQIPYGKVTTYGAIAEVCGVKSAARTVMVHQNLDCLATEL